jgi:hypothetical protein
VQRKASSPLFQRAALALNKYIRLLPFLHVLRVS